MTAIRVDFLDPGSHGLPGRLGLTIAPGKWRPGPDPASDTLVRDDLVRLRDVLGTKVLVTLLEDFEMRKTLAIPELLPAARRLGLRSLWFPIPDVTAPSDMEGTARLVDDIVDAMSTGESFVGRFARARLGRASPRAIERVATDPLARAVKLADLRDDLDVTRLEQVTERDAKRISKYLRSLRRLPQLTGPESSSAHSTEQ